MTKQVTFQASEDFSQALPKAQVNEVAAWVAANPKATIVATGIAEGACPLTYAGISASAPILTAPLAKG